MIVSLLAPDHSPMTTAFMRCPPEWTFRMMTSRTARRKTPRGGESRRSVPRAGCAVGETASGRFVPWPIRHTPRAGDDIVRDDADLVTRGVGHRLECERRLAARDEIAKGPPAPPARGVRVGVEAQGFQADVE